jgi:hypothetical protein
MSWSVGQKNAFVVSFGIRYSRVFIERLWNASKTPVSGRYSNPRSSGYDVGMLTTAPGVKVRPFVDTVITAS